MVKNKEEMVFLTYRALVVLPQQITLFDEVDENQSNKLNERELKHSKITLLYDYLKKNKKLTFDRGEVQRYYLFVNRELPE